MTILSVIKNVVLVTGLKESPSAVMSSTEREHLELARLANEMALRITQEHDWQKFSKIHTTTADGVTVDYDVPSDFGRFEHDGELWSSQYSTCLSRVMTLDEWIEKEITDVEAAVGEWIFYGDQIHLRPAPANGVLLKYAYQRNTIVRKADLTLASSFTADTDTFQLNEKLLELGIIWQWKANKGVAYDEDMQNFELLKSSMIKQDGGSPLLRVGRKGMANGLKMAYPRSIVA
jgi:hypothetical protein